ncbi:MAG: AAA family ATPase [Ruminococcus sp.]|nr:AAA family ATPase [Ruminococcus sp.]
MICYKINIELDKPIPTVKNDRGRREYDEETVNRINNALSDHNSKYLGRRCAFIYQDTKSRLSLGFALSDGTAVAEAIDELMLRAGISGRTEQEEITVKALERLSHTGFRNTFDFDSDDLDAFGISDLTRSHYPPEEKLAKEYTPTELKKSAELGLYADSFLPEIGRIGLPAVIENAQGHPVHYIVRTGCSMKVCDRLIDTLHRHGRLGSRRYVVIDSRLFRYGLDAESLFRIASGGTVVFDLSDMEEPQNGTATANMLPAEIYDLIKEHKRGTLVIFALPNCLETQGEKIKNALPELTFVEITERLAMNNEAKKLLRAFAKADKVKADRELLSAVAKDTGYYANDLRQLYDVWYTNALKTKIYPQYSDFKKNVELDRSTAPTGDAYTKLSEMIGLTEVKKMIDQAVNYSRVQKRFAERGMPNAKRAMHMVFTGAPGTAKTTVARLFAQILKDNEVLSVGDLIECGRKDLVGQFVGWTAVQVKNLFKRAKGSVLFIDEAYSLVDDRSGSFGDEAINTIVQEMENAREDTVVIFAGYPKEMNEFIERNPGLRSRITFYVDFPDYSAEELYDITKLIVKNNKYKLAEDARDVLIPIFEKALLSGDFGNGRYARNLVEQAQLAQAMRLSKCDLGRLSGDELLTLTAEDFAEIGTNKIKEKDEPVRRRIGFGAE